MPTVIQTSTAATATGVGPGRRLDSNQDGTLSGVAESPVLRTVQRRLNTHSSRAFTGGNQPRRERTAGAVERQAEHQVAVLATASSGEAVTELSEVSRLDIDALSLPHQVVRFLPSTEVVATAGQQFQRKYLASAAEFSWPASAGHLVFDSFSSGPDGAMGYPGRFCNGGDAAESCQVFREGRRVVAAVSPVLVVLQEPGRVAGPSGGRQFLTAATFTVHSHILRDTAKKVA